jgi:hypothetical protein
MAAFLHDLFYSPLLWYMTAKQCRRCCWIVRLAASLLVFPASPSLRFRMGLILVSVLKRTSRDLVRLLALFVGDGEIGAAKTYSEMDLFDCAQGGLSCCMACFKGLPIPTSCSSQERVLYMLLCLHLSWLLQFVCPFLSLPS